MNQINLLIEDIAVPEVRSNAVYDAEKLSELKQSIVNVGIQFRPLVRPLPNGKYELVDGLHRIMVWKELGNTTIDCDVEDLTDEAADIKHIVSNHHRGDSDPVGLSKVVGKLLDHGKTLDDIAKMVGYTKATLELYALLKEFPPEYQQSFTDGKIKISHVREVTRLDNNEDMMAGLAMTARYGWPVMTLHHWVNNRIEELKIYEARREAGVNEVLEPPPARPEIADIRQCLICGTHGSAHEFCYPALGKECFDALKYLLQYGRNPLEVCDALTKRIQELEINGSKKDAQINALKDKILELTVGHVVPPVPS